jgi:phosphatidylserine/phosphatidylglycerophosphate/cardiolipin synthase-like enzyme
MTNMNRFNFLRKIASAARSLALATLAGAFVLGGMPAEAKERYPARESQQDTAASIQLPAAGSLEVAFSPNESSEALVLKVINSARADLRMLAYSLTSKPIVDALIAAHDRGVHVYIIADAEENTNPQNDKSGAARAALARLKAANVDIRTISVYPIHHDKVIIVDGMHIQFGSFNYSAAAAHRNSENVFVNWNNPGLAQVYLAHFARNYPQSVPY